MFSVKIFEIPIDKYINYDADKFYKILHKTPPPCLKKK